MAGGLSLRELACLLRQNAIQALLLKGALIRMSHDSAADHEPQDAVEAVVPYIPVIIPAAGAVMMFLLAFIAVNMA